jgi:hypothetical protein
MSRRINGTRKNAGRPSQNKGAQITKVWRSFARWNRAGSTNSSAMIFVLIGFLAITIIVALAAAVAQ